MSQCARKRASYYRPHNVPSLSLLLRPACKYAIYIWPSSSYFLYAVGTRSVCDFISGQNVCKCVLPRPRPRPPAFEFSQFSPPLSYRWDAHKQTEDEAACVDNK